MRGLKPLALVIVPKGKKPLPASKPSAAKGPDITVRYEQYISVKCLRRVISIDERVRISGEIGPLFRGYG